MAAFGNEAGSPQHFFARVVMALSRWEMSWAVKGATAMGYVARGFTQVSTM